jgi:ATP-dependent DNA helicase DinG
MNPMKTILESWSMRSPPRASQIQAFEFLEKHQDKKYFIIEAAVGTGKSIIAKTFADYFKQFDQNTFTLTHQKILQKQYSDEFQDMFALYGKSNYSCSNGITCDIGSLSGCTKKTCPAKIALADAQCSSNTIMNYAVALTYFLYKEKSFQPRQLMVLDEAHELDSILTEFNNIEITRKECNEYGIEYYDSTNLLAIKPYLIEEYKPAVRGKLKLLEFEYKQYEDDKKKSKRAIELLIKINELTRQIANIDDFIECDELILAVNYIITKSELGFKIKMLYGAKNFKLLEEKAEKFLFLSATILDHNEFCRNLNIPIEETAFISLPSEFPVENRLVHYMPVTKVSYGFEDDFRKTLLLINTITDLLTLHENESGVIHTGNFRIAQLIESRLKNKISHKLFHYNPGSGNNRGLVINEFLQSDVPSVIIGPSLSTGLDLKDDLGRFNLIVKLPYSSMADNWVKKRMKLDKSFYSNDCIRSIIQASGRCTRHETDISSTYILDENFSNLLYYNRKSFPPWWIESVIFE